MRPLGVGFIGAGAATQAIHLPTLATLSDRLRVAHVFDVDALTAADVAGRVGARGGTSLGDLLDDPGVEVVAICSPEEFHADQVEAACRAGKRAILCEKPLAISREERDRIVAASNASAVPVVVGTMHAWDPAWRAASLAWGDLPATVRAVRSVIYLPMNGDMIDLATDLFAPPGRASADIGPEPPELEAELATLRDGILGLAMHATPLIRELVPGMDQVTHARVRTPWGYSISYQDGDRSVTLVSLLGGRWDPHWTLDAWGATTEVHAEFPPSYVMAGSATASVRGADGTRTWRFDHNGYQAEWTHLADVAEGRAALSIPVSTVVDDLEHALALADAAVEQRRSSAEATA